MRTVNDPIWRALATVMATQNRSELPSLAPQPRLLDRQGWSTLLAGALLLLISFTTNYGDENLSHFGKLAAHDKVGICLHLAALATRLRHRAANEAARTERARQREADAREREADSRKREALEAAAREQRQNRALRAGALFLLEPSSLHRRFLAYIVNELAGLSQIDPR